MTLTVDAVVVGSGINGMVAAAELAQAGWEVALCERNPRIGGFISSEERTLHGYVHDTYSSWHPLFTSGPAYAALGADLERHGLSYCNTDGAVTASIADNGRVVVAHRDADTTVAAFAHVQDRRAYLAMLQRFTEQAARIGALMSTDLRAVGALKHLTSLAVSQRKQGTEDMLRDLATSGRAWARREYAGTEVDHLWSPWLLHAGLAPDNASGGFMMPMLAASVHFFGLPVVQGGAGQFVAAFEHVLAECGVHVLTGTHVDHIDAQGGRAVGVRAGATTIRARRAVLASVTPQALFGELLPADSVSRETLEQAHAFRAGRAEMQIHVALDAPMQWKDERLGGIPLVHVSDGSDSTAIGCAEAEAGLLPRRPTVVVGQQYLLDPTRVPEGRGALWLQLQEVPFAPVGDAADELDVSGGWTPMLASAYAQRVIDRVARHTTGLADQVLAVDVVTPADLAAYNVNAFNGDPYGGSAELDQNLWWRSIPAANRRRHRLDGLWQIGASTHPGPGLSGGSGHRVAQQLLARRLTERIPALGSRRRPSRSGAGDFA